MFNLSVGSFLEWPGIGGLIVGCDDDNIVDVSEVSGVWRVEAIRQGNAIVRLTLDDAFYAEFNVRVFDDVPRRKV